MSDYLYFNQPYKIYNIGDYSLLPTNMHNDRIFPEENFKNLLNILSLQFEYILIDAPPLRVWITGIISKYCNGAFFVTNSYVKQKINSRGYELKCPIIENIENNFRVES